MEKRSDAGGSYLIICCIFINIERKKKVKQHQSRSPTTNVICSKRGAMCRANIIILDASINRKFLTYRQWWACSKDHCMPSWRGSQNVLVQTRKESFLYIKKTYIPYYKIYAFQIYSNWNISSTYHSLKINIYSTKLEVCIFILKEKIMLPLILLIVI